MLDWRLLYVDVLLCSLFAIDLQEKYFYVAPFSEHPFGMAVHEGGVLEVTLAQFWNSLGSTALKVRFLIVERFLALTCLLSLFFIVNFVSFLHFARPFLLWL